MERQRWTSSTPSPQAPEECLVQDGGRDDDNNDAAYDYVRLSVRQTSQTPISRPFSIPWHDPLTRFWKNHVRVSVRQAECRDHLANERTFLGYLRTSSILSVMGVVIAQLYRLQHAPNPSPVLGYYLIAVPLAALMQVSAVAVVLIGAHRFWRQQCSMARGKVHAGGWEIYVVSGYILILLLALFAIHVGVDVYKSSHATSRVR